MLQTEPCQRIAFGGDHIKVETLVLFLSELKLAHVLVGPPLLSNQEYGGWTSSEYTVKLSIVLCTRCDGSAPLECPRINCAWGLSTIAFYGSRSG